MEFEPDAVNVTIPAGQSLSGPADLVLARLHRLDMPAAWTAASITLQVSEDGETFNDVFLDTAEYVVTTAAPNRSILIDQALAFGVRYWRVRSGTSAAPVNQAADRVLQLVTAPQ